MLICSVLQRPRAAGILATLVHFISYFLVIPISDQAIETSTKEIASFIPNIALALSVNSMVELEKSGDGLHQSTIKTSIHNYEVWIAFKAWIIMFFVLNLIALYLDKVLPKEHGIRQPLYFFLDPRWWCRNIRYANTNNENQERLIEDDNIESISSRDFEVIPPSQRELQKTQNCMKVKNLSKVYGNKASIKGVSLTMYSGEIFILLGHNGAGKSTILSTLAGTTPNSGGTATCFGIDMFKNVEQLRRNLGVCPQFDIIFDYLTPREHLKLSCIFKGIDRSKVNEQITKTLDNIDLSSKSDVLSHKLSGGEKRKLSVGIAMVGDSRLILLDEPTSGIDIAAKTKIWDMLSSK